MGEKISPSPRTTSEILADATETLKTAELGYDILTRQPAEFRLCGLRNLVVFGRAVTFVLQNLRNTEPEFDKWYSEYAQEMKSDPLLTYFKELRNILEKEGNLELSTRIHLKKFVFSRDLYRFGPPPANAKSMFIGDSLGGAGWEVELPDGSIEKYYVNLPSDLGEVALYFPQGPKSHLGKEVPNESIEVLSGLYLNYLENLVKQAQQEFGK